MSTLKLKKPLGAATQGNDRRDSPRSGRPPVRPPGGGNRIRPTLAAAQRERAEREERAKRDADRRDGSKPIRRSPESQGGAFRSEPRSGSATEPRFEGGHQHGNQRDNSRNDSRSDSRGQPDFGQRTEPRFDSRNDQRNDQRGDQRPPARDYVPRGNAPVGGRDRRPDLREPRRDAGPGAPNDRGPGQRFDPRDERRPSPTFDPRGDRGGDRRPNQGFDSRNDRRPPQSFDPRNRRFGAGSGGRDDARPRRPDPRDAERPDIRPALPPEPELRSDAEHEAFPNRPTGMPPPHVQGTRTELEGVRLSKRMSELGLASRREADEWIQRGWVRVDGVVVSTLGSRVTENQTVEIDERAAGQQAQRVTVLLHKPAGYVSGQAEDGNLPASVLCTPNRRSALDNSGITYTHDHVKGIAPAGRLDMESTGLLVFTQDGRVAKQLIGGDANIEKEYFVKVGNDHGEGRATGLSEESLALLNEGISLEDVPLRPAEVSWVGDELRFVLREGKKRQIRRMCEAVGLQVLELRRVRIGKVMLGDLAEGEWRYLAEGESFA